MIEIRDARGSDAHGIAVVHTASWQMVYRGLLPGGVLDALSIASREQAWADALREPPLRTSLLVAAAGEAVVGFASVGPSRDVDAGHGVGELYAIYLHPDHWGRGIGSRLHAAAAQRLNGLGFTDATLWVLDGNVRAISFYRRLGWAEDGQHRLRTGPDGVELHEHRLRAEGG